MIEGFTDINAVLNGKFPNNIALSQARADYVKERLVRYSNMSNEKIVEELLWDAHKKGLGTEVLDTAKKLQTNMKLSWVDAVSKAYDDWNVESY